MVARRIGRQSFADRIRANRNAEALWAGGADRVRSGPIAVAPKRAAAQASGMVLERVILKETIAALRKHPKVTEVRRNQVGTFRDGERYIRVGQKGLLDLSVNFLKDGIERYGEVECKSASGALTAEQSKRIEVLRKRGGFAGMVRTAEEAVRLINIWTGCNA